MMPGSHMVEDVYGRVHGISRGAPQAAAKVDIIAVLELPGDPHADRFTGKFGRIVLLDQALWRSSIFLTPRILNRRVLMLHWPLAASRDFRLVPPGPKLYTLDVSCHSKLPRPPFGTLTILSTYRNGVCMRVRVEILPARRSQVTSAMVTFDALATRGLWHCAIISL